MPAGQALQVTERNESIMKKRLACMLLMSALALSMTACGGKDNGAASGTQETTTESTAAGQATGEAESTTAGTQDPKDTAKALQDAKKAVTDALGDNYWPDSEIPEEMLGDTFGISADLYDAYLGEAPMISVNVDTLLIIHAKDGKVEEVENALNAYRDHLVSNTMQYPMNLGKIQASRIDRVGDYVCFVQLGADTSSVEDQGDEAVITYCQEQNELALEAIRQTLE